ncbi:hypothetical protein GE09DRAFT_501470 [Coniochaeta sp. 2T2.1]|nr:hypothetical protein GE09DRAFT_501470 [Coniochaeta sp. 2T2.1]
MSSLFWGLLSIEEAMFIVWCHRSSTPSLSSSLGISNSRGTAWLPVAADAASPCLSGSFVWPQLSRKNRHYTKTPRRILDLRVSRRFIAEDDAMSSKEESERDAMHCILPRVDVPSERATVRGPGLGSATDLSRQFGPPRQAKRTGQIWPDVILAGHTTPGHCRPTSHDKLRIRRTTNIPLSNKTDN